jgi:hypothetical protein
VPINGFGTGSANGPVPPAGESDQRQADGSIVAACPTPKAPNISTACPGTAPGPFAGVSLAAHRVKVDRHGHALVRLRCPTGTNGSCVGTLTLTGTGSGLVLGKAKFEIHASSTKTVKVSLSTKALRALARHGSLTAVATATAHGTATVSKTTTAELTLSRSP